MVLVFDQRAALAGAPGVHALIAGVSAYPHLPGGTAAPAPDDYGMRQLSSTALTAYRMYRWLMDRKDHFQVPLATVRLLLSPAPGEIAAEPGINGAGEACTLEHFQSDAKDWRTDAGAHADGYTFFYFAGHGVQRSRGDQVMLMEDFGDGLGGTLAKSVNTKNIYFGMARSDTRPSIAQNQLYFVDACRVLPSKFLNFEQMPTGVVWDVELPGVDERRAPIFYAALPGDKAYAVAGDQTLFSKALLSCLNGGAGELDDTDGQEHWHVTMQSLSEALPTVIDDLNETFGADQEFTVDGVGRDVTFHLLDGPPDVDVVLDIAPEAALQVVQVQILDSAGQPAAQFPVPLAPHPYKCTLKAGTTRLVRMRVPVWTDSGTTAAGPATAGELAQEPRAVNSLKFDANFGSNDLGGLDVPVEVRAENLALVSRGLASQSVDVPPGTYHVTAKMPAGQQLYCEIEVPPGKDVTAELRPQEADASPHESQARQHFFIRQPLIASSRPLGESPGATSAQVKAQVKVRAFTGNPLNGTQRPVSDSGVLRVGSWSNGVVQFNVTGSSGVTLVQLLQPGLPVTNKTVPAWGDLECTFQVTRLDDGHFAMDTHLQHSGAELLIRYRDKGYLQQASSAVASNTMDAEALLNDKSGDPIAAAVGAYTLLRLGDLDRLHGWTEDLLSRFPTIPDGVVIRAEYLASTGQHAQAVAALGELPARGMPIFTDGLSYALDRLRLYVEHGRSSLGEDGVAQAATVLKALQPYVAFTDFRRSFTSFSGLDPASPGDEFPQVAAVTDALDLALYFA